MILFRTMAMGLIGLSLGAAAQPAPKQQQPATAAEQKPNLDDKVSCRVSKEGNSLRRTCMTKSQWKKLDSQSNDVDESGLRNSRCPMGAC